MTQDELNFSSGVRTTQKAKGINVETLCSWLKGRGWVHADVIEQNLGLNERTTRKLRSMSKGLIISGDFGYKHISEATPEEVEHSANKFIKSGKEQISSGIEIKRAYHKFGKVN